MGEVPDLFSDPWLGADHDEVVRRLSLAFERSVAGSDYQAAMERVVPGTEKMYGVKVPVLRALARQIVTFYRKDPTLLKDLAERIWREGSREHKLTALFLLANLKRLAPAERWELGVRFLPDVTNWEECDQLCHALLGQALAEDARYMSCLEEWAEDDNLWVRRASLVSPVLLRRAHYPAKVALDLDRRALAICAKLLDDPERYMRKAVDWCIREVAGRHRELARDWMLAQAERGTSRTARTTLKLASKKLSESERAALIQRLNGR